MNKLGIIDELKRIQKGYSPVSKAWPYQVLCDVCNSISIIVMRLKRTRKEKFRYECPRCGKESNDSQVIFDCIYDHEYNKSDNLKE